MRRVFVTRRLSIDPAVALGEGFDVEVHPGDEAPSPEALTAAGRRCDAMVTLLGDAVDEALLRACPRVRVVANHAVGFDNVDVPAATRLGVWVTNTPDVLTESTADLTWALLLSLARRVREGEAMVRRGRFLGWSPTLLLGLELEGRTLGIVGFGRIGRAVARRATGFGMRVLYASRSDVPRAERGHAEPVAFAELLRSSDVVSLHCPLTVETRHLVGAPELAAMRPGALLLNTSRGPVVDEASLVAALASGSLGGAGLDVYEDEPRVHPGLVARDDVVLLPHIGSATHRARRRMAEIALDNVRVALSGERPPNALNDPARPR